MGKIIKITIPEPCHEDWAKMTPKEKGRFCDSCAKVVVDMTKLTDHEIFNLVDTGSNICGRFRNDQLDRPMRARIPYRAKKSSWAIAASLLVGLSLLASCENPDDQIVGEIEPVEFADTTGKQNCGFSKTQGQDSIEVMTVGEIEAVDDSLGHHTKGNAIVEPPVPEPIKGGVEIVEPLHTITSGKVVPEVVSPPEVLHTGGEPVVIVIDDDTTKKK